MAAKIQISDQERKHLLHTGGDRLELDKSTFYVLTWNFSADGLPTMKFSSNVTIMIKSSSNGQE